MLGHAITPSDVPLFVAVVGELPVAAHAGRVDATAIARGDVPKHSAYRRFGIDAKATVATLTDNTCHADLPFLTAGYGTEIEIQLTSSPREAGDNEWAWQELQRKTPRSLPGTGPMLRHG